MTFRAIFATHFEKILEMFVLVFIFVFGVVMLAKYQSEEMTRFIENGAVIAILARAFGTTSPKPAVPPDHETTLVMKETDNKEKP